MDKLFSRQDIARSIFNSMNKRDFSEFENFVSEEVIFDFPGAGRIVSVKRVLIFLKALLRKYPKLTFTLSEIITDKQKACAVWTNEGEDINGNAYSNSGITLLYFRGNKLTFISDYFKDTSFVNQ